MIKISFPFEYRKKNDQNKNNEFVCNLLKGWVNCELLSLIIILFAMVSLPIMVNMATGLQNETSNNVGVCKYSALWYMTVPSDDSIVCISVLQQKQTFEFIKCCKIQLLHDWCLQGVNTTAMGLAQQMGHKESSDGNVMSDSNDCLAFNISIRHLTLSISSGVTCVGTANKFI